MFGQMHKWLRFGCSLGSLPSPSLPQNETASASGSSRVEGRERSGGGDGGCVKGFSHHCENRRFYNGGRRRRRPSSAKCTRLALSRVFIALVSVVLIFVLFLLRSAGKHKQSSAPPESIHSLHPDRFAPKLAFNRQVNSLCCLWYEM